MKVPLRKIMAEQNIKKIKKQLEDIDGLEAQSKNAPMERTDDTYLAVTYEDQKQKLLKELEKQQKIVAEESAKK
ncbi:MAG TPA: hypothetical protein PLE77_09635 [Kiritimatiellia bacterium]|nr:hypothetical protein [Kiritimatiellia bacterium]